MPFHRAVQEQLPPRSLHQHHSPLHWAIFLKLSTQAGSSKRTGQTYFLTGFPTVLVYRVCCPEGLSVSSLASSLPTVRKCLWLVGQLILMIFFEKRFTDIRQWPFPKYWPVPVQQNNVLPIDVHIPNVQNVPVKLVQKMTIEAVEKREMEQIWPQQITQGHNAVHNGVDEHLPSNLIVHFIRPWRQTQHLSDHRLRPLGCCTRAVWKRSEILVTQFCQLRGGRSKHRPQVFSLGNHQVPARAGNGSAPPVWRQDSLCPSPGLSILLLWGWAVVNAGPDDERGKVGFQW